MIESITSVGSKMDTNERHYKMQTDSQTQKLMLTKMERWRGVGGVISLYISIFTCQNWCGFCCLVAQSCLTLCNPMHCGLPGQRMPKGFSRQEYWSGLPFPSSGNLPNPGIESRSPESFLHCGWILLPPSEQGSHKTGAEGL